MIDPFEDGVTTVGKLRDWLSKFDDETLVLGSYRAEMADISLGETEVYEKDGELVWWNGWKDEPSDFIRAICFDVDTY